MPRDGSGVYRRPIGIDAVSDTTIESSKYNTNVLDVELDLNTPRPIMAGGTAATSADGALDNFQAEKFLQLVTNWDATPLRAGSVYAPITVGGTTPVAGHAFAGICYYANATDLMLDVTDITAAASLTCNQYIRVMTAGVWGPWIAKGGGSSGTGTKTLAGYDYIWIDPTLINQGGGGPAYSLKPGQISFNQYPTNEAYYGLFILMSHITKSGTNLAQSGPDSIKNGYKIRIQDALNPTTVYQIFDIVSNLADVPPHNQNSDFYFEIGGPHSPSGHTTYQKAGVFVSGHPVQVITSVT